MAADTPMRLGVAASRRMRCVDATEAEKALWRSVRDKQLGVKFRRQHPIGPFIADFVCIERRLIVEIDGGQHGGPEDERRTAHLERHEGFKVIRFWNNEVLGNLSGVLETIVTELNTLSRLREREGPDAERREGEGAETSERDPHPGPPPRAGEGEIGGE